MPDAVISVRGVNPASNTPPGDHGDGGGNTSTVSITSDAATTTGDYLILVASVDWSSSLSVEPAAGVDTWTLLGAANQGTTKRIAAWLGRVNTSGPRTVTARQPGTSVMQVQVWTLDAVGLVIERDGNLSTTTGTGRPYTFASITLAGDRTLLVAAHSAVQFSGTNLDYTTPDPPLTVGTEQYWDQHVGQVSAYEQRTVSGGTGTRQFTSNIPNLDGGGSAGVMFGLRAQQTYVEATPQAGPIQVSGPAPTIADPTVVVPAAAGTLHVDGPTPALQEILAPPTPGVATVDGPAPAVAHVYYPPSGPVQVAGLSAFAGGTIPLPGVVTVRGPQPQLAYGSGFAPHHEFVPPLPDAQPTRVLAQNIRTGEWLHWDLPVENLEVTEVLSGPQTISGVFTSEVVELRDVNLEAWATWVHVEEGGLIRASGILQPSSIDQNEQLTFDAVGVSAYPKGIPYVGDFTLSGTDAATGESGIGVGLDPADIVRDIWAHIQSYEDGDLGVWVEGDTPVRLGTPPKDVEFEDGDGEQVAFVAGPYSKLDWWEAQDCGTEIDNLAKQTPFDYIERQAWNADQTDVLHWIEIGYPRLGRRNDDVRFAQDENVLEAIGPEEPDDRYGSAVYALGKGEGSARVRGYAARPVGTRLRRVVIVDDKTMENAVEANSEARVELESRQALQDITELVAEARHPNAHLGAYAAGDEVEVEAEIPWHGDTRAIQRIMAIAYSPGSERVKLTMRSASAFIYGGSSNGV